MVAAYRVDAFTAQLLEIALITMALADKHIGIAQKRAAGLHHRIGPAPAQIFKQDHVKTADGKVLKAPVW